MNDLSAIHARLVLRGHVECASALRIGAARDVSGIGSDLPVLRDARQMPFIPGSSFKGVLRSSVEAMVRAASPVRGAWDSGAPPRSLWCCDPLSDPPQGEGNGTRTAEDACLSRRWKKVLLDAGIQDPRNDKELPVEAVLEHSCSVCRLFGNTEMAGRLMLTDMRLLNPEDLIHLVEVRDGVAIDRDSMTAADGLKYDFEVVPAGARFELEIVLDNPDHVTEGLLAAGLDAMDDGHARLGGFGSRGLGRVRVLVESISSRTARQILLGEPGEQVEWDAFRARGSQALGKSLEEGGHA